jgi:exosortase
MINYVLWVIVAALYAPIFYELYQFRWDKVDYTHAYFILPISIWLAWRHRSKIKENISNEGVNKAGLIVLFFGALIYIFGRKQDYLAASTFSLVPLLFGLIIFVYGYKTAKILTFPILYLILLIPPPFAILDSITLPMRNGASFATEAILQMLQYPVSRDGLLLKIGYHDIFMGAPCSGFRSLITMISLVLVYVYITKGSMIKKIALTSFIIPLALIGNLIRVITLCLITFYFGEAAGQGFFHNFSGIVIFIITITGLMGIESVIDKVSVKMRQPTSI